MSSDQPSPKDAYSRRVREIQASLAIAKEGYSYCKTGLIIIGLLACVLIYQALVPRTLPIWLPLVLIPFAAFIGSRSNRYQRKLKELYSLEEYYEKGLARLGRDWKSLDTGQEFADVSHPYASDLDLFGEGSLFQLLCSARTGAGRETLAAWMKAPANLDEVAARRAAVSEICARQDLRESLATAGARTASDCKPGTFREWAADSSSGFPAPAALIAPLLVIAAFVPPALHFSGRLSLPAMWQLLELFFLMQAAFAGIFFKRVRHVAESIRSPNIELPIISELLRLIERGNFSSPKLVELANRLKKSGASASTSVHRLRRLVKLMNERDDPWFTIPSYFLLWVSQFAMAIERWRRKHSTEMLEWLAVIGEYEALVSLAVYSFEHPRDVWPEFLEAPPLFDAEAIGHPLLDEATCVRNDVSLDDTVRFLIVSGSNMSGKSTFLRAVGLNAVLAQIGAPVRCAKLRLSPVAIGAAIRLQDSVIDGRSHFLAEMQRLRDTIEVAGKQPLLFLADELLSGTNSHDRRIAAEWVVRALLLRRAIGLITTHDLALTEIAANGLPGQNFHFEDSGESGNLLFDYKLRPGLLTHSNALNIAHLLGIDAAAEKA